MTPNGFVQWLPLRPSVVLIDRICSNSSTPFSIDFYNIERKDRSGDWTPCAAVAGDQTKGTAEDLGIGQTYQFREKLFQMLFKLLAVYLVCFCYLRGTIAVEVTFVLPNGSSYDVELISGSSHTEASTAIYNYCRNHRETCPKVVDQDLWIATEEATADIMEELGQTNNALMIKIKAQTKY
uniref:Uncharacterized protein n=1 Tax=Ditylenchus dipsaci TaxID=166011 RepID=A0A915EJ64_9BILA